MVMSFDTGSRTVAPLSGLLVGLVALGFALLVASMPWSPLRSSPLELVAILLLPVAIAVLAYVWTAPSVAWWEVGALAVWGALGTVVTAFVSFLATMCGGSGYPGAWPELLRNLALFLAATAGLGVPYALAGRLRRDRPWASAASALLAPVVAFVLFSAVAVTL